MKVFILFLFVITSAIIADEGKFNYDNKLTPSDNCNKKSYFQKYKKIYFITGFGTNNSPAWLAKKETHNQIKFQISFKYYLISNIYFGYTQKSVWDIWDIDRSSPFQDSNYNPEIFYNLTNKNGTIFNSLKIIKFGLEHESNGQSKNSKKSRSWNRIYTQGKFYFSKYFKVDFKLWVIFDKLVQTLNLVNDDLFENNDIGQYYGNFDLKLIFSLHKNFNLEFLFRKGNNLDISKGYMQIAADFRIPISFLSKMGINPRYYIQIFNGYGETLINYNHYQLKYRFGIMLFY